MTVINLNKFKKTKNKQEKSVKAEQNRVIFGRTKSEKKAEELKTKQYNKNLNDHKLDD